jgi:hypothetical protein
MYFHCFVLFLGDSVENLLQYYNNIEIDNISGCKVTEALDVLVNKTWEIRISHLRVGITVIGFEYYFTYEQFTKVANSCCNTFLLYLEKRSNNPKSLQEIRELQHIYWRRINSLNISWNVWPLSAIHKGKVVPESWDRKIWVMCPAGPETKNDCAGQDQQQSTRQTKLSLCLIKHHTTGELKYSSAILDLGDKRRWMVSFTSRQIYSQGKESPVFTGCGVQGQSGWCGEDKKKILSLSGIEPGRGPLPTR